MPAVLEIRADLAGGAHQRRRDVADNRAMTGLRIPCPKCRTVLQLPDPRYLGRRGRCAACGHAFELLAPQVEIELQPAAETQAAPVALSAGWGTGDPEPLSVSEAANPPQSPPLLEQIRRKRRRRRRAAIAAGAVTALVLFAALIVVRPFLESVLAPRPGPRSPAAPRAVAPVASSPVAMNALPLSPSLLAANAKLVASARPTHGPPIDLRFLPSGINCLIHLRPAELWSDEPAYEELRATLTQNVTDWIARQLQTICRREPSQIDEALIGILLGPTGSAPDVAAVVRLREPALISDLVLEFQGEPLRAEGSWRLIRGSTLGCLIVDAQTIALCPAAMAEELAEWVDVPNYNTTDGILQLLEQTDRQRLFTVLFEVDDVRRHEEWLFAETARPAFRQVLELIGEEAQTVGWSLHVGDAVHSELHFRTRIAGADDILGPTRLAETLAARFDQAPHRLLNAVRETDPQASGARRLIGRLPAMLEAACRATVVTTDARRVQFTTRLPAKAAPNLALASLLTWDALRQSAAPQPGTAAPTRPRLPETVVERLQLPVDAEFRRTPLRDALAYICGEIQVHLQIDGDALKDAGYTQNLPQDFKIGRVPAAIAISRIVGQYDGDGKDELRMVVVVDEPSRTLLVLTQKFAEQKGLSPLELPPPP